MPRALLHTLTYLLGIKEEKLLPPIFLDYKSMVAHDFIVKDKKKMLKYRLIFDKNYFETITLPAPSLFNILSGMYLVLPEAIHTTGA